MASAVAHALGGQGPRDLLEQVARETRGACSEAAALSEDRHHAGELAGTLALLGDLLDRDLAEGLAVIAERAGRCLGNPRMFATKSVAMAAVPTALLVAARHLDDLPEAISEAISLGGDTDTVAAIAGAVVGARVGVEAIPSPWIGCVIAAPQVIQRADALFLGTRGEPWDDLVAMEARWTRREVEVRATLPSKR